MRIFFRNLLSWGSSKKKIPLDALWPEKHGKQFYSPKIYSFLFQSWNCIINIKSVNCFCFYNLSYCISIWDILHFYMKYMALLYETYCITIWDILYCNMRYIALLYDTYCISILDIWHFCMSCIALLYEIYGITIWAILHCNMRYIGLTKNNNNK